MSFTHVKSADINQQIKTKSQNVNNITDQHLKLLKQQNVKFCGGCEYGATEIDPKRPYGNSYVEGDMLEILNMQGDIEESNGSHSCSPALERKLFLLHVETSIALQICMALQTFETGKHTCGEDWICGEWKKVEEVTK